MNNTAPLSDIRVLDLTRYLAGPFATMLLSDYGADVVKIESTGDREFRSRGNTTDSYFFLSANRGKRSVTLNLKKEEGRKLFLKLVPEFDVVIENFRPGVMKELGLGAELLLEVNPGLIYCGISGFGATGPYAERPGFDQIAQGLSGFMSLTGTDESGPTRAGIAICDLLGGIFAAHGIQLALLSREKTGKGQIVHTSLLEAMVSILSWGAGMFFDRGTSPGPAGQHHPLSSPYGRFAAKDGYLNIAAGNEKMWGKLASALGKSEWVDSELFHDSSSRIKNRQTLTEEIEKVLSNRSVDSWVELINSAGVPCGPVLNMQEVFENPQVLARNMKVEMPHPEVGTFITTGLPVKLSETPGKIERRPALHGEHTEEILREFGIEDTEIDFLKRESVIGSQTRTSE
ncbi:CoA transferase [Myxococcota bacterium]|nr:CoA transferase [Myxococcota bacterium]